MQTRAYPVHIFESKPLPKYGPPTYEQWLWNELQAMNELFRPELNMLKNLPKMLPGISLNIHLLV